MELQETIGYRVIRAWMEEQGRLPFAFQEETWQHILSGRSGLVNAPTGCGKTFSVWLGVLIDFINRHPEDYRTRRRERAAVIVGLAVAGVGQGHREGDGGRDRGVGYALADRYEEWGYGDE